MAEVSWSGFSFQQALLLVLQTLSLTGVEVRLSLGGRGGIESLHFQFTLLHISIQSSKLKEELCEVLSRCSGS